MDQIFITDLVARGLLGVNEWKRENIRDLDQHNIILRIYKLLDTDDIQHTISYKTVAKKVLARAETAKRFTVEALATDIAQLCLDEPGVERVRVRVEKPHASRFARSVGVEIERNRGNQQP
jgi:FolB domain-containing protein